MKKVLQLTFIGLLLFQVGFSQQLQTTQWTTTWGSPISDDVCFTFGTDTVFITGSAGNEISTTLYTETGNTVTFQDVSGPFSCPNTDVGTYEFEITSGSGAVLNFTVNSDACTGRSGFITSNELTAKSPTGINNLVNVQFNVYPNPATNQLIIKAAGQHGLVLYNSLGKTVFEAVFADKIEVDCSSYPGGAYFIKVDRTTRKLILD